MTSHDPPSGTSTSNGPVVPRRHDLGAVALVLVGSSLALMAAGYFVSLVLGFLLPLPFFLTGVMAVPPAAGGLVVGLVAAATGRGRWKGGVAAVVALPTGAAALSLAAAMVAVADGSLQ